MRQKKARAREETDRCGAHGAGQAGLGTPVPTVRAAVHTPPSYTLSEMVWPSFDGRGGVRAGRKRGGGLAGGERRALLAQRTTPRALPRRPWAARIAKTRDLVRLPKICSTKLGQKGGRAGPESAGARGGRRAKCSLVGSGLLGCAKFACDVVPASLSREGGGHARGGGAGTCTQGQEASSPWYGSPSARLGERP